MAKLDPDTILYLTLLMLVWIVPSVRSSPGLVWAGFYVIVQWAFVGLLALPDNPASIIAGVSLLLVHLISSLYWEDPFSRARMSQAGYYLLHKFGRVLELAGIKPGAQLLNLQDQRQVSAVSNMLERENWAAAEQYLAGLSFAERCQVIEGVTDDVASGKHIDNWLQSADAGLMSNFMSAQFNIKQAWARRGSGVSETVTRNGLSDFHIMLELANSQLRSAIETDDHYAEPYIGLITIAMGTGDDRDALYHYFAKAVRFSDGHYDVHIAMINALSEKWGGEPGEAIALASQVLRSCNNNDPAAGVVAVAHIEHWLYLLLCGQEQKAQHYFLKTNVLEELNQAYHLLEASQAESLEHIQALNALAFCFYMGDQYVTAKRIFNQLNGQYVVYPWQYCSEPLMSLLDPGFAIDLVARRLDEIPKALRA